MDKMFESLVKGEITQQDYESHIANKDMIGKRVKSRINIGHGDTRSGQIGTIIFARDKHDVLVEYDEHIEGHDGADTRIVGKDGHCWWMTTSEWKYVESEVD